MATMRNFKLMGDGSDASIGQVELTISRCRVTGPWRIEAMSVCGFEQD